MTDSALVLIHDDGHVTAAASGPETEGPVRFNYAVMTRAGITGFRLARLGFEEAARRLVDGRDCDTCAITASCGCLIVLVQAGGCPHGSAELIGRIGLEVMAEQRAGTLGSTP